MQLLFGTPTGRSPTLHGMSSRVRRPLSPTLTAKTSRAFHNDDNWETKAIPKRLKHVVQVTCANAATDKAREMQRRLDTHKQNDFKGAA